MSREHGHGNKIRASTPARYQPEVCKVPTDSVPYGESISTNGSAAWAAYDPDTGRLVCVAASAKEVRGKYRDAKAREERQRSEQLTAESSRKSS